MGEETLANSKCCQDPFHAGCGLYVGCRGWETLGNLLPSRAPSRRGSGFNLALAGSRRSSGAGQSVSGLTCCVFDLMCASRLMRIDHPGST